MVELWCSSIVPSDCNKAWQTGDWGPGTDATATGT